MKNIMKSIGYDIMHSKMLIRIYIMFVAFMALVTVLNVDSGGVSAMLAQDAGISFQFSTLLVGIVVGVICGGDFADKVASYEILSGHSRKSIFFARALIAIIIGAILTTTLGFVPIILGNTLFDWGNKLVLSDIILRTFLLVFPLVRLAAFFVVISFVFKNPYVIIASGFVIMVASDMLSDMTSSGKSCYISTYNMSMLCSYEGWSTYNLDPVKGVVEYYAYNSAVTTSLVLSTIIVSLIMAIFYLFMGYALFRRDEMN